MIDNTPSDNELTMRFTKNDQVYEIRISLEDKALFDKYRWSLMVGRNGYVALHRTEKKKKIYFSREVLQSKLAEREGKKERPLEKGESCKHIDGNSANKTRDNLEPKVTKALAAQRAAVKEF